MKAGDKLVLSLEDRIIVCLIESVRESQCTTCGCARPEHSHPPARKPVGPTGNQARQTNVALRKVREVRRNDRN